MFAAGSLPVSLVCSSSSSVSFQSGCGPFWRRGPLWREDPVISLASAVLMVAMLCCAPESSSGPKSGLPSL